MYVKAGRAFGVPVALEVSRSGVGMHGWVFFTAPVSAGTARRLGTGLLREAMAIRGKVNLAGYDRLFPSQDLLPAGGVGNLIALPLFRSARDRNATVFLNLENLEPHQDQWFYLSTLGRMTPKEVSRATAGGMLPGIFITQQIADTARVVQQGPVMNFAAAAAIFSGSRASWRCARGRPSSFHRPTGPVTRRQRRGTGAQSDDGKRPHPGMGHPPLNPAPRPRRRARPHPAAATPLIRPTPAPAAAATPRQTPARQAGDREARQPPAHGRPLHLPRLRPAHAGNVTGGNRRGLGDVGARARPVTRTSGSGPERGGVRAGLSGVAACPGRRSGSARRCARRRW
jgi:TOTE conflict system, Archaeo-Eukaryotic Primase domain